MNAAGGGVVAVEVYHLRKVYGARFGNRVAAYLALMGNRYPSTDDHQSVHLGSPRPGRGTRSQPVAAHRRAAAGHPPNYVVLAFLDTAAAVIVAWFIILFTGRYPTGMFSFVKGVIRWHNRLIAYAFTLVTDRCPPFRLAP